MNRHSLIWIVCLLPVLMLLPFPASAEENSVQADRPGLGTGPAVLGFGDIQWETGFEEAFSPGIHLVALPATLFRFGLHERVELRMEYEGVLTVYDSLPGKREVQYIPEHLLLGTKLMLWQGSTEKHLRWIPQTSMMLQLGIPTTKELVDERPVIGMIDLLFENEVTNWFSVGYDVGAHWLEWKPEPDVFASLSLNFQPTEQWGCFIENFNYFGFLPSAALNTVYNVFLDFGITYSPHPRVQLDVNAGFNCYDSEPLLSGPKNFAFAGLGIAWKLR